MNNPKDLFVGLLNEIVLAEDFDNYFPSTILLWQDICWGYQAILMQNSVFEDSEVSHSRLPIRLHYKS